MLFFT